ncbi:MAG: hypothetical protein NTZ46_04230 [Verrucomicrobia bacterium]|nr:hypothetical protein [Verrucomicrobiota bacterium]
MNPILDQLLVAALILAALAYFVFRKKKACGGGCDCPVNKPRKP